MKATMRKALPAAALVVAGFGAGATIAAVGSATAADTAAPESGQSGELPGDPGPRGGLGEEPLTGDTADQVEAAVLAEYPDATIERLETDSEGVYEAHIVTAEGEPLTVLVDKDFNVTGTQAGGFGGRGGPGGPCDDDGAGTATKPDAPGTPGETAGFTGGTTV